MGRVKQPKPTRDEELAKAAACGEEAGRYMLKAATEPVNEVHDYNGLHCVRQARLAVYHAFKARPDLKPKDRYEESVDAFRAELKEARANGHDPYPWL